MTNNLINTDTQQAIALMKQQSAELGFADSISEGLGGGFKFISIAGGKFTVNEGDKRVQLPTPFKCVILARSKYYSKSYFAKAFVPGKDSLPDCCSADGIRPDAGVPNQQNVLCTNCEHNQFGTKGNGKACSDKIRIVLMQVENEVINPVGVFRLDVPPDSFKNLNTFSNEIRKFTSNNIYSVVLTEISFDLSVTTPRLQFNVVRALNPEEINFISEARMQPIVSDLINMKFQVLDKENAISTEHSVVKETENDVVASTEEEMNKILEDIPQ